MTGHPKNNLHRNGTYRIVHHGDSKAVNGMITPFTGTSRTFTVS